MESKREAPRPKRQGSWHRLWMAIPMVVVPILRMQWEDEKREAEFKERFAAAEHSEEKLKNLDGEEESATPLLFVAHAAPHRRLDLFDLPLGAQSEPSHELIAAASSESAIQVHAEQTAPLLQRLSAAKLPNPSSLTSSRGQSRFVYRGVPAPWAEVQKLHEAGKLPQGSFLFHDTPLTPIKSFHLVSRSPTDFCEYGGANCKSPLAWKQTAENSLKSAISAARARFRSLPGSGLCFELRISEERLNNFGLSREQVLAESATLGEPALLSFREEGAALTVRGFSENLKLADLVRMRLPDSQATWGDLATTSRVPLIAPPQGEATFRFLGIDVLWIEDSVNLPPPALESIILRIPRVDGFSVRELKVP